jgi:hypothetical protein
LVAAGGECTLHEDCEGDSFCDKGEIATCPGTCKPLRPANAECFHNDDAECSDGLVCANDGKCHPLGGPSAPCGGTNPSCKPGLYCDDENAMPRLCIAYASLYSVAEGEECDINAGPLCQPGLVCESTSSVSTAGVCRATVAEGETCKRAVPNQCPIDQYCDAEEPGMDGTCVDRPGDGEPCLVRSQPCAAEHLCICDDELCAETELADGTCLARSGPGEACVAGAQCYGGECGTDGTCTEALQCQAP